MPHNATHGLIAYGPNANCTLALCPIKWSVYGYIPNRAANIAFLVLFGIALILHLYRGIRWREWVFTSNMAAGCISEMIGYGGRIMLSKNPFSFVGFMVQICCITFAPVFYCAAIYVLLSRTVRHLDPSLSRFKPILFIWLFLPCDLVSLILQATGGAMSSTSSGANGLGVHLSVIGLSLQVVTLFIFSVLCADYAIRYYRSPARRLLDKPFKLFAACLVVAIVLIFIRCAYRIQELREGYGSVLMSNQGLFIALEGVMVLLAAYVLALGHPGPAFKGGRREMREKSLDGSADEEVTTKY